LNYWNPGERFNTYTQMFGLVLAVLGLPILLANTLPSGNAAKIVGTPMSARQVMCGDCARSYRLQRAAAYAEYDAHKLATIGRHRRHIDWRRAMGMGGRYVPLPSADHEVAGPIPHGPVIRRDDLVRTFEVPTPRIHTGAVA
jgi:hypothetical protein